MKKQIMKRAWEIAKEGQKKFGGKVSEYIAIALKLAWKEVKEGKMEKAQLKGTPKQVAWAEVIRDRVLNHIEEQFQKGAAWFEERGKRNEKYLAGLEEGRKQFDAMKKELCSIEDAAYWIDDWKFFYKTREKVETGVWRHFGGEEYKKFRSVYIHGEY